MAAATKQTKPIPAIVLHTQQNNPPPPPPKPKHVDFRKREGWRIRQQASRKRKKEEVSGKSLDWVVVAGLPKIQSLFGDTRETKDLKLLKNAAELIPAISMLRTMRYLPPIAKLDTSKLIPERLLTAARNKAPTLSSSKGQDPLRSYLDLPRDKDLEKIEECLQGVFGRKTLRFTWALVRTECICSLPLGGPEIEHWHYDASRERRKASLTLAFNISESVISKTYFHIGCWGPEVDDIHHVRCKPGEGMIFGGFLHSESNRLCEKSEGKCGKSLLTLVGKATLFNKDEKEPPLYTSAVNEVKLL
ncbi:hypothetical protein AAMO2058_000717800 [Amorphochlora amoebiformis]|eukprot:1350470-Amorphochlora_amoeboformis.AAC.1